MLARSSPSGGRACTRSRTAPYRGVGKKTYFHGANGARIAAARRDKYRFTMLVRIPRKDTTDYPCCAFRASPPEGSPSCGTVSSTSGSRQRDPCPQALRDSSRRPGLLSVIHAAPGGAGSKANADGLLRRRFPTKTDFSRISRVHCDSLRLNQRPRKTLGFQTPADRLQAVLH